MIWNPFKARRRRNAITRPTERETVLPGGGSVKVAARVDCIGASCPRPQMMTLKVLNQIKPGEVVELLSDNPTSVESISALMSVLSGEHLGTVNDEGFWRLYLRKGEGDAWLETDRKAKGVSL